MEDVLNENEKSRETMAAMLGRIVRETCGEEEFKRQVTRAQKVIEEESKKKAAIEAGGGKLISSKSSALQKILQRLDNPSNLEAATLVTGRKRA